MVRASRAARVALVVVSGVVALAPRAGAQRSHARPAVGVTPAPVTPAVPYPAYPGASVTIDPRGQPLTPGRVHQRNLSQPSVMYVPVPVVVGDAYGEGGGYYPRSGYGQPIGFGGVTDVNGRPLSAGAEAAPTVGGFAYTPDFSGAPYSVTDGGTMVVDFPDGGRRGFPSCASQSASRDPDGRTRTVFYQPAEYGLVLHPGQHGRVLGTPAASDDACYAADSYGRVVLRY